MTDTAQNYQKLLSEALQKQMIILGRQITLAKARHVLGLSLNPDGQVAAISGDPQKVVIQFLEEFRELSSPLVKKTMQPLLNIVLPPSPQQLEETTVASQDLPTALPDFEKEDAPHDQNQPEHHEQMHNDPDREEDSLVPKP
ncbi:MAG: hypothetical protein ACREHC_02500 [Candidatus Levyibacteriota bacterium]